MDWATPLCPDQCRCKRLRGRARQERNARILRDSDTCHICGEPGADAVDHVRPWSRTHDDTRSNLRPAHHHTPNSNGRRCNMVKGDRPHAPIIRRSRSLA